MNKNIFEFEDKLLNKNFKLQHTYFEDLPCYAYRVIRGEKHVDVANGKSIFDPPPPEYCKTGRFNENFEPVLYLSRDPNTCKKECSIKRDENFYTLVYYLKDSNIFGFHPDHYAKSNRHTKIVIETLLEKVTNAEEKDTIYKYSNLIRINIQNQVKKNIDGFFINLYILENVILHYLI